ncbi:MAG: Mur ligase family protein [Planctomycetota bacterium]
MIHLHEDSFSARVPFALSQVLKRHHLFSASQWIHCDEIMVSDMHDDPINCRRGDIFIARETGDGDGHDRVAEAISRGVAGIVAERMVVTGGVPLCLVPDSTRVFSAMSHAFYKYPADRLQLIAITGTSGKTSTTWTSASVLAESGLAVGVVSDLGVFDSTGYEPNPGNLEHPKTFSSILCKLVQSGCTHVVAEISSQMLAQQVLEGVTVDTAVITNLADAHEDLHGSRRAYHALKARLVHSLSPTGCLIVCADQRRGRSLRERWDGLSLSTGLQSPCDVEGTLLERSLDGQTFLLRIAGHVVPVCVPLPTAACARNCLQAAAVGLRYGVAIERIASGIESSANIPGRLERLNRGQAFALFLDQPTSVHALKSSLRSLRRVTPGRLILLIDRAFSKHCGQRGSESLIDCASCWCDDAYLLRAPSLNGRCNDLSGVSGVINSLRSNDCLVVLSDAFSGESGASVDSSAVRGTLIEWVNEVIASQNPPEGTFRPRRAA